MRKILFLLLGAISGFLGLVALVNLLYNLAGLAGLQDAASGQKMETALAALLFDCCPSAPSGPGIVCADWPYLRLDRVLPKIRSPA